MEDDELHKYYTNTNQLQHLDNNIVDNEKNDHGEEQAVKDRMITDELRKTDYTNEVITYDMKVAIQSGHDLTIRASNCRGNDRKPRGKKKKTGDCWDLKVVNGMHNHPFVEYFEGHSYARRLTHEQNELLVDMSNNLVRPKEILCNIKNLFPSNATTLKLFIMCARGIESSRRREGHRYCTYKTNRYRMPLFEVVGITSTCLTFSVAFAYIGGKRIDNYLWVLQRLRSIMEDNDIELL
ncbi:uncharacterized protein LOC119998546 [Tripterygium wilfordii]|uniref:uncharacterized protein LOC119998546 n=1 Tax=Tripterygium wilfordii TaxID=458696 RepID=UPI0018F82578|nr:uncharacterized protein LOC119998546 [Tripterygium wilfordii]